MFLGKFAHTLFIHAGTQTAGPSSRSVHIQCNLLEAPPLTELSRVDAMEVEDDMKLADTEAANDPDYTPTEDEEADYELERGDLPEPTSPPIVPFQKEPKYLVFKSSLLQLLKWCHCPSCGALDIGERLPRLSINGSQLCLTISCSSCGINSTWKSQPSVPKTQIPVGNLLISAGILFAGATPTKVLRVFKHIGLVSISTRTFHRHQAKYLEPVIESVWQTQQNELLRASKGSPLSLGGDGRADTPGHSAKFGSYTMMDLRRNKILDFQLVQVNC